MDMFKRMLGKKLKSLGEKLLDVPDTSDYVDVAFNVFHSKTYKQINEARLSHLVTLGLPLAGKTVLEVGAGIGLHTAFFEDIGCKIISTDGRQENVDEMKRRYPHRVTRLFDLLDFDSYNNYGEFDIVYCYGTLYHTPKPEEILRGLSSLCQDILLLETCVTPGDHKSEHLTRETESYDQAIGVVGCRPTRPWIMDVLTKYYGHAYVTKTQPRHVDFDLDWKIPLKKQNHRSIFVASKRPLNNPLLSMHLLDFQLDN